MWVASAGVTFTVSVLGEGLVDRGDGVGGLDGRLLTSRSNFIHSGIVE